MKNFLKGACGNAMRFGSKLLLLILLSVFGAAQSSFAHNYVDSDLSNVAGSNSGKAHADIYIFILAMLILSVIAAYLEDRVKAKRKLK